MNPIAAELNETIRKENPYVFEMLSGLGREMFFPRGILTQSAEAKVKAKKFNATLGIAKEGGHAMFLTSVMKHVAGLTADEALNYAPPAGLQDLRQAWRDRIVRLNPSLVGKGMSMPVVTNGLTGGLSVMADLFCDIGDAIILPDQIWGNYRLTFCTRRGGEIHAYPFYTAKGGFNVTGLAETIKAVSATKAKVIVLLNFPNNPTGYSPTRVEGAAIAETLRSAAAAGTNVVALCDDAYYGLFYENDVLPESVFSLLSDGPERLLAVKCDAATKELFVWGLRVGFISINVSKRPNGSPIYAVLEKKICGVIRGVLSNCATLSQQMVLRALKSPEFEKEAAGKREVLKTRALELKRVLSGKKYDEVWRMYPFNSGYFMCVRLNTVPAEKLRVHLLDKYGVGTIATAERDLRLAFSCIEKEKIAELFDIIYTAALELR